MGSLSEIKKELEVLEDELSFEVCSLVDLEEKLEEQNKKVDLLKGHKKKLQRALAILEDRDIPEPKTDGLVTVPPSQGPTPPAAPTKPVDTAPICSACDKGRMRPAVTRAPSGVYINMLRCDDGACNNEAY